MLTHQRKEVVTLVMRILIGVIFIVAGWMKVTDMTATVKAFSGMGIPAFLAYIVSYVVFLGGIAVVLGLWTDYLAPLLAIIMIVAFGLTYSLGFAAYGMPLATLSGLLGLWVSGPGKYAIHPRK